MKSELIYVELKSGQGDSGPAWIGYPSYSKSRATIYFNGLAFKSMKGSGISGNYYEASTGDEYWISGVKKNGQDRHWAGGGEIIIDSSATEEYLKLINASSLPKDIVVGTLVESKPSREHHLQENERLEEEPAKVLGRRPIAKTINRLQE